MNIPRKERKTGFFYLSMLSLNTDPAALMTYTWLSQAQVPSTDITIPKKQKKRKIFLLCIFFYHKESQHRF